MRIVLTGSSSHLARALLPRLCAHPSVERVTGIDLAPPHFGHSALRSVRADIRDPALARTLQGHDVLINLAFLVLRGRTDGAVMQDINIRGTQNLFRAARGAGVGRLIHLSSAAVYGSGENLREDAPFSPLPAFLYGQHKARVENWLATEFPTCARLRPHVILGPHAQPLLRRLLAQRCYLRLPDPQPRLQCVHEEDVVDAVLRAMENDAHGAFNLAAEDCFSVRDEVRRRHRVCVPLPPTVARAALAAAWRISGWGGEPAWLDGLAGNLTLDCSRARALLGWRPRHTSAQTLSLS